MSIYNHSMLPIGTTNKRREGEYLITYEVVGWNDRAKCNVWAEKNRKYSPANSINTYQLVEAIKSSQEWECARIMAKKQSKKED